jgi:streptomycin 6-kinase
VARDPAAAVFRLPEGVRVMAGRDGAWARWVEALPGSAQGLLEEWQLDLDGPPQHGHCSLVLPVRTSGGRPSMLKIGFPDDESQHEHLALRHWAGVGAVQLLRADPRRRALLLERLHPEQLTELSDIEACDVVAGLYCRLHVPAPPTLRRLTDRLGRWVDRLSRLPRSAPLPHRLVEQAVSIAEDLSGDADTDGVMVHGDLHYDNVLAADREPWLVIDPKPLSGDPHFEPAPMLWNRWDEVVAGGDVRGAVRRRFHALVDGAGLDEERARDWVVLREVLNAAAELDAPTPDADWITTAITIAKAVQD